MSNMGKGAGYYLTRSKSLLIDTAIVAILAIFMSFAMQMDTLQSKGDDYLVLMLYAVIFGLTSLQSGAMIVDLTAKDMMNFYSSNIFSGYASWEHIEYMLDAIKKLYPKKNIFIDFTIDSEARIALKKDNSLEQTMQIIKELVNNVYKHAAASFIHLEIALNEESKLVITCQNDGAKSNDIENILSSKGGMLFLTVLINGNGGNIQYLEKDGILTATAVLGRKNEDITI